jgi:GDP-4-dehydro-6-deoxy-D-mannose reductase
MRVLITGVAGFCGPHLVKRLRQEGNVEIAGLDIARAEVLCCDLDHYFQTDICDRAAVASRVAEFRPDSIFHLAGMSAISSSAPGAAWSVNVIGVLNVLEAVRLHEPSCKLLVTGSAAEYGMVPISSLPVTEDAPCRPTGAYGASKYAATLIVIDYVRRSAIKAVVVRPFNIIGSGIPATLVVGSLMARAKEALASKGAPVIRVGDSDSERDFIAVSEAMDAYVRLLQAEPWGEVVNICSGRSWPIHRVAHALVANSPRSIQVVLDPDLFPPSSVRRICGSNAKARQMIGFEPAISLEQELKTVWDGEMGMAAKCA